MEVIDIQCDSDLKAKFIEVGVSEFYKYLPARFENTRKLAYEIMSMFGKSSDICSKEKTWRLASGRVDDPAWRCQERLTSERPTSQCSQAGKEETSDSYIQDVLHLCREVNPAMMENEIVAHLTKGISEEIYQSIIILDIATNYEFIKWCRKIEVSHKQRVNKRIVFDRLLNVAAIDSADSESMEDLIRHIVR
ncbi:GTF2IRD2B [Cordylochernes scorpioides]|uniref:GTF2IRD2B n=1 Tax=Cordylochernes scorpioides TaxID=51811 RepID=A0ABY6LI67_9ARAC|nr:GTF2IRD2B [Cordylochernes scorpioides]